MHYALRTNLNKNHDLRRDFCFGKERFLFSRFYDSAYATSAQNFSDFASILKYRDLLQIWSKFTVGRSHRKAAIVTKGRRLPTFFTLCHNKDPFNYECLELAGLCTAQQTRILPQPVTFHKNWVLLKGEKR